jgi:hypothetical protein
MSAEEVLKTELIVNQALIDILIAKRVISEKELVEGIRKIRQEQKLNINDTKNIIRLKR